MNVRVNLNYTIYDGAEIVFKAPCDASRVTGLIVYYPNGTEVVSSVFAFADAHTNDLGNIDNLFVAGAVVKVILDTETNMAFVQNAATNAYLEGRFAGIGGGGSAEGAVLYTEQVLTEEQKAQARQNIDAAAAVSVNIVAGSESDITIMSQIYDNILTAIRENSLVTVSYGNSESEHGWVTSNVNTYVDNDSSEHALIRFHTYDTTPILDIAPDGMAQWREVDVEPTSEMYVRIISDGDDAWYTRADFQEAFYFYMMEGHITIYIETDPDNQCLVTSIEVADLYDYMTLHSGAGVFQWNSDDTIEKIADADNGGSVDLSNYYTKDETNQLAQELFNGLEIPSNAFIYEEAVAAAEFVVNREIGDISSALDELHAYAEALKGGGAV